MSRANVPVLIVGGGSVGPSAALFLAHHTIPALVVERHVGPSIHPRAAGIGVRTMELFRAVGLEPAVRAAAALQPQGGGTISVETLAGADLRPVAGGQPSGAGLAPSSQSPTSGGACSQDRLDPVLLDAARRHGATVRFNTELSSVEQDGAAVTATLVDRDSGDQETIRADYVIAADGAAGRVRHALGVPSSGPGSLGHSLINVLFEADLSELVHGHEFLLCEIRNPQAPGLLIRVRNSDRWVFHFGYDPAKGQRPEDFSPERCRQLVRAAIGLPQLEVATLSILPWQVEARVADRFQQGRAFLVGDAAHVVPPLSGFGMNTGIADAHNLAWKLALVLAGNAAPALLDTYDCERRPVARFTMNQALLRLAHPHLPWDPSRGLEREQLGIADPLVVHLGYRYTSSAIIGPRPAPPSLARTDRDLDGSPGTRLPHLWVERRGERVSTRDLIDGRFTLLAGPGGADWCEAVPAVAARAGIDLAAYRIGADGDVVAPNGGWQSAAGIEADGALLVRPDGFVAWRAATRQANPPQILAPIVERLLGRWHAR